MHCHFPPDSRKPVTLAARLRAFVSCRRCLIGWTLYIVIAIVLVALYAN